jgi:hypothetical protein
MELIRLFLVLIALAAFVVVDAKKMKKMKLYEKDPQVRLYLLCSPLRFMRDILRLIRVPLAICEPSLRSFWYM